MPAHQILSSQQFSSFGDTHEEQAADNPQQEIKTPEPEQEGGGGD